MGLTIGVNSVYGISWLAYIGLLFVYSLVIGYGCYFVNSGFFMPMYCFAKTSDKVIALTFDDGPLPGGTPQVLQILKAANVEAAFFCIGNRIAGNEQIIKQLHADGHIIGNHSFTHSTWFDLLPAQQMLAEMQQTDEEVYRAIGKRIKLFRPPYGVMDPNLKKAIITGSYLPIGWNVRSYDTMAKDADVLLRKVMAKIKPGAVLLFHDRCPITVAMLPAFIEQVKAAGYKIERLDKILGIPAYA